MRSYRNKDLDVSKIVLLDEQALFALPEPEPLIAEILFKMSMAVIYGEPGSYKSFCAVDMAMSVATGNPWHGREVKQGHVIYVAAEGATGYKRRVEAWKSEHDWNKPYPLWWVPGPIQLADDRAVDSFITVIRKKRVDPALIIFDTLSRNFVGRDENAAGDMSRIADAAAHLTRELSCAALFVHHSRKAGDAERGSSALKGAADTMILARVNEPKVVTLECKKMKDAREFEPMRFVMKSVASSLVPESTANPSSQQIWSLDKKGKLLLALLSEKALTFTEWAGQSGLPNTTFKEHRTELVAAGLVGHVEGRRYALTAKGADALGLALDDTAGPERPLPMGVRPSVHPLRLVGHEPN